METRYKYQFTKTFYLIAVIGGLVALGCIAVNAVRFINLLSKDIAPTFYEYVSLILSVGLSLFFIVFMISAFINSYYKIEDSAVVLRWGIIKNTINIADVKEIKLITNQRKLELTFEDESYFIIVVSDNWKEKFVDELRAKFPKIPYIQETEKASE